MLRLKSNPSSMETLGTFDPDINTAPASETITAGEIEEIITNIVQNTGERTDHFPKQKKVGRRQLSTTERDEIHRKKKLRRVITRAYHS